MVTKKMKNIKKSYILCNVFGKSYKDKLCKFPCGKTPCKIYNLTEAQKREFERERNEEY
jgi:hypothetical protein